MRRLLVLFFLLWPWTVRAQEYEVDTGKIEDGSTLEIIIGRAVWVPHDTLRWTGGTLKPTDSVLALCKERGHVKEPMPALTDMCCPSQRLVDLPDRTLVIYEDPNQDGWHCKRCGMSGVYGPDTILIWHAPPPTGITNLPQGIMK